VSAGALLYDNWWVAKGSAAPTTTHPAYPSTGQSGSDTWRCKECHGWDYQGAEGAYATGSHFTGIPGVFGARVDSSETIGNQIKSGANHDFSAVLSDQEIGNLVAFIKEGTINMNDHINFSNKTAMGNATTGQALWSQNCEACHGADGRGTSADVGALAADNPWEVLHKIRWGHPGTSMPSMVVNGLTTQQQVDILAYAQTL
jgi:thiosulfate dehydrogenase